MASGDCQHERPRRRMSVRPLAVTVVCLVLVALGATSASARHLTFPGRNGKIELIQACFTSETRCDRFASMNPDGSGLRVLRSAIARLNPRWSPNGRRLLIWGATGIALVPPAGGPAKPIMSRAQLRKVNGEPEWPDWLGKDGKRIVFLVVGGVPYGVRIYTIGVDGRGLRKIRRLPGRNSVDTGFPHNYIWLRASPDGRKLAFEDQELTTDEKTIDVMNANGSGLKRLAGPFCLFDDGTLDWAPDSRRLLASWRSEANSAPCTSDYRVAGDSAIYLLPVGGGPAKKIYTEKLLLRGPNDSQGLAVPDATFSPDGKRIAFAVQRNTNQRDTVMTMSASGAGVRIVRRAPPTQPDRPDYGFDQLAWQPLRR